MHGALRAFRERGVQLGVDLSFVGCDDVAVAELHTPQIAVVRRDMVSIGEASADLLLELLKGSDRHQGGHAADRVHAPAELRAAPERRGLSGDRRPRARRSGWTRTVSGNVPR